MMAVNSSFPLQPTVSSLLLLNGNRNRSYKINITDMDLLQKSTEYPLSLSLETCPNFFFLKIFPKHMCHFEMSH